MSRSDGDFHIDVRGGTRRDSTSRQPPLPSWFIVLCLGASGLSFIAVLAVGMVIIKAARHAPPSQTERREVPAESNRSEHSELSAPWAVEPVVTQAEYGEIANGMSYRDVVGIIGHEGTELSRNHIEGAPGVMQSIDTAMYGWSNPNGSNMNAMFQNDKLMQKAQFGLK